MSGKPKSLSKTGSNKCPACGRYGLAWDGRAKIFFCHYKSCSHVVREVETPAISETLYLALFNKLEPDDFDRTNETDLKLLEYLGWLGPEPESDTRISEYKCWDEDEI